MVDSITSISIVNGYNTVICDEVIIPLKTKATKVLVVNNGTTTLKKSGLHIEEFFVEYDSVIKAATEFISYDFEYIWLFIEKYIQKISRKRFKRYSKSIKDYTPMLSGDNEISFEE